MRYTVQVIMHAGGGQSQDERKFHYATDSLPDDCAIAGLLNFCEVDIIIYVRNFNS